jgi:hypothetical protein
MALAFRPIHDVFLRYSECLTTGSNSPNRGAKALHRTQERLDQAFVPTDSRSVRSIFVSTVDNAAFLRHGDREMAEPIGASRAAGDIALQALILP